jgi:hypothetical protein
MHPLKQNQGITGSSGFSTELAGAADTIEDIFSFSSLWSRRADGLIATNAGSFSREKWGLRSDYQRRVLGDPQRGSRGAASHES